MSHVISLLLSFIYVAQRRRRKEEGVWEEEEEGGEPCPCAYCMCLFSCVSLSLSHAWKFVPVWVRQDTLPALPACLPPSTTFFPCLLLLRFCTFWKGHFWLVGLGTLTAGGMGHGRFTFRTDSFWLVDGWFGDREVWFGMLPCLLILSCNSANHSLLMTCNNFSLSLPTWAYAHKPFCP